MNMTKFKAPLLSFGGGLTVLLVFGFFLGYAANLAEPAMEILGTKVQRYACFRLFNYINFIVLLKENLVKSCLFIQLHSG
jgi:hypothetical protein